ncbi:uncharacterized protein LOC126977529 [Leptidea sinapis]|uniref:uncharacterized protein LOC126977529 n=1 Tax=Leptidea sinapis TaxID=189913 RepID=UPI002122CE78|nr:uncharacterized protein LOC126977529 [Leptidea sinapis]
MSATQCSIQGCKTSIFNKEPGISLHSCPTSNDMRNKWLHTLKNKCTYLDWLKSKICSKHFHRKYIEANGRLKANAIPTIFNVIPAKKPFQKFVSTSKKIEKGLSNMAPSELISDIRISLRKLKEPNNLDEMVTDNLQWKNESSQEGKLWLIIKKQEKLIATLSEQLAKSKNSEALRNNSQENIMIDKNDQTTEAHKIYTIKCLQEKLATLEEQIEILTAVESR